jgi:uncharacterized Tic20 family protein
VNATDVASDTPVSAEQEPTDKPTVGRFLLWEDERLNKMLTSAVSSVTSITTMLAIGVTTGSALLCIVLIGLLTGKELSVTYPDVDAQVKDSLNAAILPVVFGFITLVVVQVL